MHLLLITFGIILRQSDFWKMNPRYSCNVLILLKAIGFLDGTIEALVEVLFAVLLGDPEKFKKLMDVIVNLLLSKVFWIYPFKLFAIVSQLLLIYSVTLCWKTESEIR